ncbi:MAG: hypothetical protein J6H31_15625 [Butyrivibrio sp.]|nr:hypothetical protein [Butyrivibrio sp.]
MGKYHAIMEGKTVTVYRQSDCASDSKVGTLYSGEVFTFIGEHKGYFGHYEVRYLNKNGVYDGGFIDTGLGFGNLAFSGKKVTNNKLGTCYRFKLRKDLKLYNPDKSFYTNLHAGDFVFTKGATAGESNELNMHICGFQRDGGVITSRNAFVRLDYTGGSMFAKNFCLYKA